MPGFLETYFCNPIMQSQGYNLVNTLVFAAIALVLAFFVIFPYFKRKGVKFDFKFALAVLGFVLLGSSARLIEDLRLVARTCNPAEVGFWLVTPGIYIAVGLFAIFSLVLAVWVEKKFKIDKLKFFGVLGFLAALPFVVFDFLSYKQFYGFGLVLFFLVLFFAIVFYILKFLKIKVLNSSFNKLAFAGQLLDGTASFVAIGFFGYWEQHPVSAGILSISPILFPIVKVLVILAILYYTDRELKDENLKGFVKVLVMIFGFAPGLRDWLTIGFSGV